VLLTPSRFCVLLMFCTGSEIYVAQGVEALEGLPFQYLQVRMLFMMYCSSLLCPAHFEGAKFPSFAMALRAGSIHTSHSDGTLQSMQ